MSTVQIGTPPEEKESKSKEQQVIESLSKTLEILELAKGSSSGRSLPSSVMLQVLLYGDTFKSVVAKVEVDKEGFEKKYSEIVDVLASSSGIVTPYMMYTYYDRFWTNLKIVDPAKVVNEVTSVMEPLSGVAGASFTLKSTPRFNWKFSEAFETYVFQDRIEGISFFNESNRTLNIYIKVRGSQPKMTVGDVFVDYYVLLRLEQTDSGVNVVYGCTCPHSRGETKDSRGRLIPPEVTEMCKHVIAGLFYFFPNVFAYISAAKKGAVTEASYTKELQDVSERYEEFKKRLDKVVKELRSNSGSSPNEETLSRAVVSNIVYLIYREFWRSLQGSEGSGKLLGSVRKIVPSVMMLHEFDALWKILKPKLVGVVEEQTKSQDEEQAQQAISAVLNKVKETGLYDRLGTLRSLLNGLQGSVEDTPYTRALLGSLVLASNPLTDPIIVSSCGDPGTGKTLTAVGLGELVGFSSLAVSREVSFEEVVNEARKTVSKKIKGYADFFEKVVLPKVPTEKVGEATEFFRRSVEEIAFSVTSEDAKGLAKLARSLSETFASLYGVDSRRTVLSLAKLYLSLMRLARRVYLDLSSRRILENRVIEERRHMLQKLQELGLISSAEEKEKFNSGSVRWDVLQTGSGYRVFVYVDLHYLLSRFKGDRSKVMKVVEELSKLGEVSYTRQKGGVAEIKLSEASYLEKTLRTREEDIGGKLIWVGGELTRMGVILIDESRRAPELLERLLTDLSRAARDSKRTNIIITTDNAEPLMEAESDPRLDAFHSRVNFEVMTPSSTVEATIKDTLTTINEYDVSGKLPLITFDELYVLNALSEYVKIPERYINIAYSIPLLMTYDFKILRPEVVVNTSTPFANPPLVLLVPKGGVSDLHAKGDYEDCSFGTDVPPIRRMPERRLGHHVVRAMRVLAVVDSKTAVTEDVFLSALAMVLPSRVVPLDVQDPYKYLDYKQRFVDAVIAKVVEVLKVERTNTERLIEVMGSMKSYPPSNLLTSALEEMIANPVLASMFCRFLEQMLVSKKAKSFVEYAKSVPGLLGTLDLLSKYEKLPIKILT